jgi:hypothetical protein
VAWSGVEWSEEVIRKEVKGKEKRQLLIKGFVRGA